MKLITTNNIIIRKTIMQILNCMRYVKHTVYLLPLVEEYHGWSTDMPDSENSECWLTYWSHTTATTHRPIDSNFITTLCNILCNSSALTVVSVEKMPQSGWNFSHREDAMSLYSVLCNLSAFNTVMFNCRRGVAVTVPLVWKHTFCASVVSRGLAHDCQQNRLWKARNNKLGSFEIYKTSKLYVFSEARFWFLRLVYIPLFLGKNAPDYRLRQRGFWEMYVANRFVHGHFSNDEFQLAFNQTLLSSVPYMWHSSDEGPVTGSKELTNTKIPQLNVTWLPLSLFMQTVSSW